MKAFISVDMEGCSGVVSRQETIPTSDFYREARRWMAFGNVRRSLWTKVFIASKTRDPIPWWGQVLRPGVSLGGSD